MYHVSLFLGNEARHFKVAENTVANQNAGSPVSVTYNYTSIPGIPTPFIGECNSISKFFAFYDLFIFYLYN